MTAATSSTTKNPATAGQPAQNRLSEALWSTPASVEAQLCG